MLKDQQSIVVDIHNNSLEVEKALDILSDRQYLTHIFYTIHDNLYSNKKGFYPGVENRADFIHGAKEALDLLATAIYAIKASKDSGDKDAT